MLHIMHIDGTLLLCEGFLLENWYRMHEPNGWFLPTTPPVFDTSDIYSLEFRGENNTSGFAFYNIYCENRGPLVHTLVFFGKTLNIIKSAHWTFFIYLLFQLLALQWCGYKPEPASVYKYGRPDTATFHPNMEVSSKAQRACASVCLRVPGHMPVLCVHVAVWLHVCVFLARAMGAQTSRRCWRLSRL